MMAEAGELIAQAHANGLLVVLWIYPRGKAVKAEKDPALIAGAAGVALCLGADFVKVNPPKPEDGRTPAEALKVAQQDAEGKVNQANMLEQAKAQAHTLVENLLKPLHRRRQRLYGDGGRPIATRARRRAALEPPFFLQRNRSPYASSFSLNASSPNVISLPALRHSRYSDVAVNSTSDDELSAVSHES